MNITRIIPAILFFILFIITLILASEYELGKIRNIGLESTQIPALKQCETGFFMDYVSNKYLCNINFRSLNFPPYHYDRFPKIPKAIDNNKQFAEK